MGHEVEDSSSGGVSLQQTFALKLKLELLIYCINHIKALKAGEIHLIEGRSEPYFFFSGEVFRFHVIRECSQCSESYCRLDHVTRSLPPSPRQPSPHCLRLQSPHNTVIFLSNITQPPDNQRRRHLNQ